MTRPSPNRVLSYLSLLPELELEISNFTSILITQQHRVSWISARPSVNTKRHRWTWAWSFCCFVGVLTAPPLVYGDELLCFLSKFLAMTLTIGAGSRALLDHRGLQTALNNLQTTLFRTLPKLGKLLVFLLFLLNIRSWPLVWHRKSVAVFACYPVFTLYQQFAYLGMFSVLG